MWVVTSGQPAEFPLVVPVTAQSTTPALQGGHDLAEGHADGGAADGPG